MDKITILKSFLNRGAQLDKGVLDLLATDDNILNQVLKIEENKLPPVITNKFLKSLSPNIKLTEDYKKLSINQLSKIVVDRYEFIKSLLVYRKELVNLISINRISEKIKQFSVIGAVSDINDVLTLEDPTGSDTFIINRELAKTIVEDEIIGIVCERQSGTNDVNYIVYPDIPLKRENNKTESLENYFFISDMNMDSPDFNQNYYKNLINWLKKQKNLKIFILGGVSSRKEDITKLLSDIHHPVELYSEESITSSPAIIQIENLQILLTHGLFLDHYNKLWGTPPDITIMNLLRKRNLNPILTPWSYNNSFLLADIPDIIVMGGVNKSTSANYKGTTILTNGSFKTEPAYWLINLQTRETFKIDFS